MHKLSRLLFLVLITWSLHTVAADAVKPPAPPKTGNVVYTEEEDAAMIARFKADKDAILRLMQLVVYQMHERYTAERWYRYAAKQELREIELDKKLSEFLKNPEVFYEAKVVSRPSQLQLSIVVSRIFGLTVSDGKQVLTPHNREILEPAYLAAHQYHILERLREVADKYTAHQVIQKIESR